MALQASALRRRHLLRRAGRGDEIRPRARRSHARTPQRQQHLTHGRPPIAETPRVRPHPPRSRRQRRKGRTAAGAQNKNARHRLPHPLRMPGRTAHGVHLDAKGRERTARRHKNLHSSVLLQGIRRRRPQRQLCHAHERPLTALPQNLHHRPRPPHLRRRAVDLPQPSHRRNQGNGHRLHQRLHDDVLLLRRRQVPQFQNRHTLIGQLRLRLAPRH